MIVTHSPLCQANIEICRNEINRKRVTKLNMPVAYYSRLLAVASGATPKQAVRHVIKRTTLQEITVR